MVSMRAVVVSSTGEHEGGNGGDVRGEERITVWFGKGSGLES